MKVLVATRSPGKQREMQALLEGHGIEPVFPWDAGIAETAEEEQLENGVTFAANARAKAEYFVRRSGLPTLADDSGLEVLALGGEPGVRSKRWAEALGGAGDIDTRNNAYLLQRLRGAPESRRGARYRCVLAWVSARGAIPLLFEGACAGRILEEPRGTGGFGYDPLFYSEELGQTFGEATPEDKHRVSHRGRAVTAFLDHLRSTHT